MIVINNSTTTKKTIFIPITANISFPIRTHTFRYGRKMFINLVFVYSQKKSIFYGKIEAPNEIEIISFLILALDQGI